MQRLLSGKLRFPGFSDDWKTVKLGEVFCFVKSHAFSRECLTTPEEKNSNIYNIHYGDIHATYDGCGVDLRKETRVPILKTGIELPKKTEFLQDGDLVMADASEDYAGVGACIELYGIENRKVTGGLHTFVLRDFAKETSNGFCGYMFKEYFFAKELKRISTGVSVYSISKTNLVKVKLSLPPLEEQQAIAKVLSAADGEIEVLERKLATWKDQKKFLLNNLVTGSIRLPEFRTTN
jgi:type I restriction enzyme S subunit